MEYPYGHHLPIFPTFDAKPSEERLERVAERLMDGADKALMGGKATQAEYDRWTRALDAWAQRHS
jgi:hypothetical protein